MHLLRAVLLVELLVGQAAQVGIEALEQVLEQQRQQPTRQLQPLVTIVVPAVGTSQQAVMPMRHLADKSAGYHTAKNLTVNTCDSV